jgi:magnesium transporter
MDAHPPTEDATRERDVLAALRERLEEGNRAGARAILEGLPPADVADLVTDLDEEQQAEVFRLLETPTQAEVLGELDEESVRSIAEGAPRKLQAAVGIMEPDEVADVLEMLPDHQADALLAGFPEEQAAIAEKLRTYPSDSAGGLMTTEFVLLAADITAREAIQITQHSRDTETVAHLFVADESDRLVGTLPLARLVFAPPDKRLRDLMEDFPLAVQPETDQEELVRAATRYDLDVVPVTDETQKLIGVVTVDDILEAAEEEADEDMYRMAGTGEKDPAHASISRSTRLRLPWLLLSVLDGLFIAFVVSRFSDTLQIMHQLSFFIPLIPLMGGQVAIQASTIMVRSIAVGDIRRSMLVRFLMRQVIITLFLAVCCALCVVLLGSALVDVRLQVMATVGVAVGIAIMFAGVFGMICPVLFNAIGLDPAVSAGPFITMLSDLFCISIYLVLGTLFTSGAT